MNVALLKKAWENLDKFRKESFVPVGAPDPMAAMNMGGMPPAPAGGSDAGMPPVDPMMAGGAMPPPVDPSMMSPPPAGAPAAVPAPPPAPAPAAPATPAPAAEAPKKGGGKNDIAFQLTDIAKTQNRMMKLITRLYSLNDLPMPEDLFDDDNKNDDAGQQQPAAQPKTARSVMEEADAVSLIIKHLNKQQNDN